MSQNSQKSPWAKPEGYEEPKEDLELPQLLDQFIEKQYDNPEEFKRLATIADDQEYQLNCAFMEYKLNNSEYNWSRLYTHLKNWRKVWDEYKNFAVKNRKNKDANL